MPTTPDFIRLGSLQVSKDGFSSFAAAERDLMSKDPEAVTMLNTIEHSPHQSVLYVYDNKDGTTGTSSIYPHPTTDKGGAAPRFAANYFVRFSWNPHAGVVSLTSIDPSRYGPGLSPEVALGHEEDHVYESVTNPAQQFRLHNTPTGGGYDNLEEARVVTGFERRADAALGESPRNAHHGVVAYVHNVTDVPSVRDIDPRDLPETEDSH